jgi:hypothetical protein
MLAEDLESAIQKLKTKKIGIGSRIKMTKDFSEKEIWNKELEKVENQIKILEDLRK